MRTLWGRIDPTFMGGEYLPERGRQEVEIARIAIRSTLFDVTVVNARRSGTRIRYRVVDEYDGTMTSRVRSGMPRHPLTLRALVDFFLRAWNLEAVLGGNYDLQHDRPERIKDFIVDASSDFYPDFHNAIESRIDGWLEAAETMVTKPRRGRQTGTGPGTKSGALSHPGTENRRGRLEGSRRW
ncbi:MAG: hypothetical protein ABWZ78_10745 [Burkholderiaceae bacterium]